MKLISKKYDNKKTLTAFMLASSVLLTACSEPTEPPKAPLSQYTQQGNTYLQQFQFKAAITSAKNAIFAYPEEIDGYLILAKIYLELGQAEASSAVLNQYKNTKSSEYYFLLLEAYQKNGKLISANKLIEMQQDFLQQQPNRLKKEQAKIFLREKDVEQASALFKELQSVDKYKADALIGLARISGLSNDINNALLLLNEAIEHDNKNSEALILKSYLQINNNDLATAEKTLSQALTIIPSADIFTPERINILQALTEVLTSQGRSSEALLYSRILADEFPEAASINQNYAEATQQYKDKEFGLAKQTLEKILKVAPSHKKSLTLYGIILYTQGDIKGAQQYLSGLIDPETDPKKLTQLYALTQLKMDNAGDVLAMLENTIATENSYETLALYLLAAINQQEFDKAKFALQRIQKLFPDNEKSVLLSANYYSEIVPAEHEKALDILQKGLKALPENIQLQTAYLKKLIYLNKVEQADNYIQTLQKATENNTDTTLLIAQYKLYKKQYKQADALFNAVLTQQESNLTALLGLAQSKQLTNDWVSAQSAYRNIILFHPNELKGYQGLVYSQIKREEDIEQTKNRLPENYNNAILALVLADAQLQQNNIEQAKVHIDSAVQGIENNLLPYLKEVQQKINYQRAILALSGKAFDDARKITLTSLQATPDNPALLLLLTKIEIESGQLNEAKKVMKQVASILPNNPINFIYQADIALAENNTQQAIDILEEQWQLNSDDAIARKLYATLQNHNKQQAQAFLAQWQQEKPDSLAASINQALMLQQKGEVKASLDLYEKVLKQNPDELTSLNNAAWLYSTLNNSRAEVLAKRAFSIAPDNAAIADTYGWILYQAGKIEEAKKVLKQAHEAAPNNAEISKHWLTVKDL